MGKSLCCVVLFGLLATTGWCELINGDFEYWSDHPDDPIWAYITTIQDDPAVGWYAHEDVDGWADPWIDDGYGGYEHIVGTNGDRVVCISWGDPLAVVSQNLGIAFVQGQTYTFSVDIFGDGAGGEHWCLGIGTADMGNLNAAERQGDALALAASNALVGEKWALGDASDYTVLDPPDTFAGWQTRTVSYTATARDVGKEIVVFFSGGFVEVGSDGDTCFDNATFTFDPLDPAQAAGPQPADGAVEVSATETLSWTPGIDADTHDIYFGTVFDEVSDADRSHPLGVLAGQGQDAVTYDPEGLLEFSQTYYWRVDELRAAPGNAVVRGKVWSFTVEPFAYPVENVAATSNAVSNAGEGPDNTINGSGLDESDQHSIDAPDMWLAVSDGVDPVWIQYEFDRLYKLHEMWVWNYNVQFEPLLGLGIKSATVEYSDDGADWTILGEAELAQGAARANYAANTIIDLGGAPAQYVRLTANSGFGMTGQFGLSEVRFMYIPAHAREAQPADGAVEVDVNTALRWRAGREAVTHDVYVGADAEAMPLVDSIGETTYVPGNLEFGSTYYWRIDEVNEADEVSVWAGDLWTFAAQEFAMIDDFESYDDEENAIFDTWLDGVVNDTGSTVGYFEAPFAERTIVNSGRQSMPLEYANDAAPFYSEAEFELGSMNLDTNGADTLRLFVAGQAPSFLETADGTIVMNAIGADIWDVSDQFRYAYKTLTGTGSMVALVEDLDESPNTWVKAGVMIRQNTAIGSAHSFMCMTGGSGNGASWQGRLTDNAASENTDATDPVTPPYWVRIDRAGDNLTGFLSPDGQTWTQIGNARSIDMTDPVLIGLALTSHNAGKATSATFSNISTTGNVTGNWQVAEVGVAQPEGNVPEALYVAVEDTSGNVAVVTHPDPGATAVPGWAEWAIPYSDLAGVNLSRVAILYIGVGDRDNPTADGTGTVFIDDIGFGHPASVE